jgi:steroid delta-isomerase-like uncharacterized protein
VQNAVVQPDAGVDSEFLEDWNARQLAAWNEHDLDAIVAMVAEDVTWDDPSEPETLHGREAVRRFIAQTLRAFPDLVIEETEPIYRSETRPKVLVPYRFTGTMLGEWESLSLAATGARVSFDGVDQWEFRDELLYRYSTSYDTMGVARQLGLLPPVGSFADRAMKPLQHVIARFQRRRAA